MKRWIFLMMFSSIFVCAGVGNIYAEDEEKEMVQASSQVDAQSHEAGGAGKVEERLEKKFNVTAARIDGLRKQGLGYGEIGLTLSLAQQMSGGINDQNIQKLTALRQGQSGHKEGWGQVAHDLGLKLRPAIKDMDDFRQDRREERMEHRAERQEERNERRQERAEERRERGFDKHESIEGSTRVRAQSQVGPLGVQTGGSTDLHGGVGMGHHR